MLTENAMTPDFAETVALRALDWMLSNDDLRGVFLGSTGADAGQFSQGIAPELLLAALDFLCLDDGWVVGFCDSAGYAYDIPNAARAALPGGAMPHWT